MPILVASPDRLLQPTKQVVVAKAVVRAAKTDAAMRAIPLNRATIAMAA
jgi:hypothetical protein